MHETTHNVYHGINGNISLDRRGELVTITPNRHDLTLGSDKSSDAGTYDLVQNELPLQQRQIQTNGDAVNNNNLNNNNNSNNNNINGSLMNSNENSIHQTGVDTLNSDGKKKKWPTDKSYFIVKEMIMTERTYKRDLDIIKNFLCDELTSDDIEFVRPLFQLYESLIEHHNIFLRDLERRLILWEGRGGHETHRIGDIMLKNMTAILVYEDYIECHRDILYKLNDLYKTDESFQQTYRDFEQQKICYLPIAYLLLKPLHRLLHYHKLLERLLEHYTEEHFDRIDCHETLNMLTRTTEHIKKILPESENYVLLCELQRDLIGYDNLINEERKLIRQGCLLKHSKRGLQYRMFFLFSDVLLYASKSPINQTFKILGHVPVRSLLTENAEHNAFIIFGGQRAITVSTTTTAEKTLWLAEFSKATADLKAKPSVQLSMGSLKNCSSSEEGLDMCGLSGPPSSTTGTTTSSTSSAAANKSLTSRGNTALHVCWHRAATVGLCDHITSAENQLSGFLLRKFKNCSGWQKLWVVFTSFCLYFHKSYQDESALASLPLLGYSVGPPGQQDPVQKEFVFKLSFKNHVYFFRAESEYSYNRWMDVLRSTTQTQDFKNMIGN